MLVSQDWLRRKVETDPDIDGEAGSRSEAQPSGYDGPGAGEVAEALEWLVVVAAMEDAEGATNREAILKRALTFTASLSDASPEPAEGDA